MDYNELYHHGIKGQKWGVIRTKEQLGYKTLNGKTTSNSNEGTRQKTKLGRLIYKSKSSAANKETKEDYEARKNKALKVGTASEILKFKGDLTNQQMQTAITRINLEKQLSDISSRETKKAKYKVFNKVKYIGGCLA